MTDKPSGFAPTDGSVVLMGQPGVLEAAQGCVEESNSNTIRTVKRPGEMWGMDEPAPWQQKQREGSVAKTPEATAPALFLLGFPLSPVARCLLGLMAH